MNANLSIDWEPRPIKQVGSMVNRTCTITGAKKRQKTIRLLLIDDSMLTLQGLKAFVSKSQHIEVSGIATTYAEALTAIETHRPDVVMLEVDVGRMSGIDLCRKIREVYPAIGVLFFTVHDNKDLLRAAIFAGAQGYILKAAAVDAVIKSIEIVASGQAIIDDQLTLDVIAWVKDKGTAVSGTVKGNCSHDDLRLLAYVASGKTNKEIALELDVTPPVVATRLQRIYRRLRISRRSEAVRYYVHVEKGLDQ